MMTLPYSFDDVKHVLENPHTRRWTVHGLGMVRTYLDDAHQWRMNIWHDALRNPGISTMHTHPWPFRSFVMIGELTNTRFVRHAADKTWRAQKFMEGKIQCGPSFCGLAPDPEQIFLYPMTPEVYGPGENYFQDPEEIHDTRALNGTVTIMNRGEGRPDHEASVFWPVGTEWGDASREFNKDDVYAAINAALDRVRSFTGRGAGDHGTASDAIEYVLDHHEPDPGNQVEFLRAWREGNLVEWPEYYQWLKEEER